MLARVILLLGVTALSLCCVEAQRKLAQSAAAPAPAGPTLVQDLLDVLGRNQSIGNTVTDASAIVSNLTEQEFCCLGPQLYKTAEAAVYTSLVYANDTSTVPLGERCRSYTRLCTLLCLVCSRNSQMKLVLAELQTTSCSCLLAAAGRYWSPGLTTAPQQCWHGAQLTMLLPL